MILIILPPMYQQEILIDTIWSNANDDGYDVGIDDEDEDEDDGSH